MDIVSRYRAHYFDDVKKYGTKDKKGIFQLISRKQFDICIKKMKNVQKQTVAKHNIETKKWKSEHHQQQLFMC